MEETTQYVLQKPVLMLAAAIMLAILLERILEILISVLDYYSAVRFYKLKQINDKTLDFWTKMAGTIASKLEIRLDNAKAVDGTNFDLIMSIASRYLITNDTNEAGLFAVSAEKVRGIYLKMAVKILAILLGVMLAWYLSIDIIALVKFNLHETESYMPGNYGYLVSGIAIGLGSGPVHKIIVALESTRKHDKALLAVVHKDR